MPSGGAVRYRAAESHDLALAGLRRRTLRCSLGDEAEGLRSPAKAVRLGLNAGPGCEVVGDGAAVAGHGGRGGVDLVDEQCEGAGDAGGAWLVELDGDRGGGPGDGAGQAADDGLAGDGAVLVVVAEVGVEMA